MCTRDLEETRGLETEGCSAGGAAPGEKGWTGRDPQPCCARRPPFTFARVPTRRGRGLGAGRGAASAVTADEEAGGGSGTRISFVMLKCPLRQLFG